MTLECTIPVPQVGLLPECIECFVHLGLLNESAAHLLVRMHAAHGLVRRVLAPVPVGSETAARIIDGRRSRASLLSAHHEAEYLRLLGQPRRLFLVERDGDPARVAP